MNNQPSHYSENSRQTDAINYQTGRNFAEQMDREDAFSHFRDKFHIPKQGNGRDELYFTGNSLGLQPKSTARYIHEELDKWQTIGIKGHFDCDYPWMAYHEFLAEGSAELVGAKPNEVVMMNSLTVNLHLMMVSFYRPSAKRYKILIEDHAFPSDHYAVESQIRFHGFDVKESLITVKPRAGEELLRIEDILEIIDNQGSEIALILLPGVQYYTGQVLDMPSITEAGHAKGCMVGFDLAHAAGNIPMALHNWNVDFACWCTYKYLNSGPGSTAGCFVHENHSKDIEKVRFAGWWGHEKETRFNMDNKFKAIPTAEGWQLSNAPILSLAAIRASLDLFEQAGGVEALRYKALQLTDYMIFLLNQEIGDKINIITPKEHMWRGCQLSLTVNVPNLQGKALFNQITQQGATTDWREPNVIRVAPVPLYNSYSDVLEFVSILKNNLP